MDLLTSCPLCPVGKTTIQLTGMQKRDALVWLITCELVGRLVVASGAACARSPPPRMSAGLLLIKHLFPAVPAVGRPLCDLIRPNFSTGPREVKFQVITAAIPTTEVKRCGVRTALPFGPFREHKMNVDHEVKLLVQEIQRLGEKNGDGQTSVKFGVLFNDDRCANLFEALVGTLKAAKKRKVVRYDGELLLQGVHDNVDIILLQAA
ncbi:hypothetical protein WMY93_015571 [Mugilogobius chulae]|uniref:Costars family protein ABRACL n=1 Tax=Mugilogobius chulae TaxID=88201 RepID=A0AAW0P0M2_9GOBI